MLTSSKKLKIAVSVIDRLSFSEAAKEYGISKTRAHQITKEYLPKIFFSNELYDDGKMRSVKEMRRVWRNFRI